MANWNKNVGYGRGLVDFVRTQVPTFGNILVVMNSANSDESNYQHVQEVFSPDQDGLVRFYTNLTSAYNAAENNNNDVILLDANSSHSITAGLTVSKNRINFIGMDGGDRLVQQGAKVQTTGNPSTAFVLKVTGVRNSFRNIKFIQNSTDAAALTVAQFGGEGTLVKNCSFVFGTATNLDGNETTTYEVVMGEDSGTFINCTFGSDTLDTTGARAVMAIDQVTSGQEMKSCIFKDCIWNILSDDANANFIRIVAATDCKFGQTFINPIFAASINQTTGGIALTDAVDSVASLVEGNMFFINPATNCTNIASAILDNLIVVGSSGIAATTGVGIQPS